MTTLTGQSCWDLVAQSLLLDHFYLQRCLSIAVAVANLCGPAVTRPRTGKSAGSPSLEELPRTSHLRTRCETVYHRVLVFCIAFTMCFKTLNTSLSMYSVVIQELM
jgi:hypothetical protein